MIVFFSNNNRSDTLLRQNLTTLQRKTGNNYASQECVCSYDCVLLWILVFDIRDCRADYADDDGRYPETGTVDASDERSVETVRTKGRNDRYQCADDYRECHQECERQYYHQ